MKTIWTWSPEARTQLRNIDPENAMRILLALTRLAAKNRAAIVRERFSSVLLW
jgi:hypothetical protein